MAERVSDERLAKGIAGPRAWTIHDGEELALDLRDARQEIAALRKALEDCVDSLEYIEGLPKPGPYQAPFVGYGVRRERIAVARAALGPLPGDEGPG